MVTIDMPQAASWWAEFRAEMREAMQSRAVLVTLIICATMLGLGLLAVVGWLLYSDKDTAAVLTLVNTILAAAVYGKLASTHATTKRVEQQTNGTTSRLMDAALKDKE